jgi:cytochrome c oxidase subunit IV
MSNQAAAQAAIDPMDPHGVHEHEHGHVIVDWRILVGVLLALLFFTFLTTTAANVEKWIAVEFDVVIPTWVNVFVAMSIAVIKATLVCMFFMQLFYDKFLNTIILMFCLLALALFLGLSALDLGGRGRVNDFIAAPIVAGGDGTSAGMKTSLFPEVPVVHTSRENLIDAAKQAYIEKHGLEAWEEHARELDAEHGAHASGPEISTSNRSVPRTGITPGLFDEHETTHDAGHDSAPDDNAPAEEGSGH